jgi:hypothetical protein
VDADRRVASHSSADLRVIPNVDGAEDAFDNHHDNEDFVLFPFVLGTEEARNDLRMIEKHYENEDEDEDEDEDDGKGHKRVCSPQ